MILRPYAKISSMVCGHFTSMDTLVYGYRLHLRLPLERGLLGIADRKVVIGLSLPGPRHIIDDKRIREESRAIQHYVRVCLRYAHPEEIILCGWGLGGSLAFQLAHDLRTEGFHNVIALGFGSLHPLPPHYQDHCVVFFDDTPYRSLCERGVNPYDHTGMRIGFYRKVLCWLFGTQYHDCGHQEYAGAF